MNARNRMKDERPEARLDERLDDLKLIMKDFERALAPHAATAGDHTGNALLNMALGYLLEQYGRERTAALLARIVEGLWSNTLPDSPERALDVFRVDA